MDNIEHIILRNLIFNEEFSKKTFPHFKEIYFSTNIEKTLFNEISDFILKYNNLPTVEALTIATGNLKQDQSIKNEISTLIEELEKNKSEPIDDKWLFDESEKFCKEKAIYNALLESIAILDDKKGMQDRGIIPELLQQALGVSFNISLGHDYLRDAEMRYKFYHTLETKIPFDLEYLNKVTNGGVPRKTLNCIMGGINVGKSLALCHLAAAYLNQGLNVLYITMEMAEEWIAQRIDANLLNVDMNDVLEIPEDIYMKKIEKLRGKITGKLKIEEYPTANASTIQFRALIQELFLKENFRPDVIIVDYINICSSARFKSGGMANMYYFVKSVAEELRGLMVEYNAVGWTATQLNRDGFDSSDPSMTNTAESFGLPATLDFMLALVSNEELEELSQYLAIQLKNRYNQKKQNKRFCIGVDYNKMRLFDLEESAQAITGQEESKDDKNDKFKSLKV